MDLGGVFDLSDLSLDLSDLVDLREDLLLLLEALSRDLDLYDLGGVLDLLDRSLDPDLDLFEY